MVANITMTTSGDTAQSPVGCPENSSGQAEYILGFWVSTMWRGLIEWMFQLQSSPLNTWRLVPKLNISEHSAQLAPQSSLAAIPVHVSLVNRPIVPTNCKDNALFIAVPDVNDYEAHRANTHVQKPYRRKILNRFQWNSLRTLERFSVSVLTYPCNVSVTTTAWCIRPTFP